VPFPSETAPRAVWRAIELFLQKRRKRAKRLSGISAKKKSKGQETLKNSNKLGSMEAKRYQARKCYRVWVPATVIAETEHARTEQLDNPESIYRACGDMKLFNQEVLRVILLDTR
jgi:DNA repair protein RadC